MAVEADPAELEQLANLSEITSVEEDKLAKVSLAESVPLIGGPAAWDSGYSGVGQTVAILDTGVDKTHLFLAGKVVSEACYSSNYPPEGATSICPGGVTESTADGSALPYAGTCPTGECDHGTHVAGIVAGTGGNFSGVAKDASLIAIQVFSRFDNPAACGSTAPCTMSYQSDEILGLERVYALRNTYNIASVNMSLGGGRYYDQSTCDSDNSSMKTAIDNLRAAGIATVIAAGNESYLDSMSEPACISSALSVGATWDEANWIDPWCSSGSSYTSVDQIACYSNSAAFLNLLAPGSA
ncbi:MAG TPA: S8 family serine peptidase, partial [Aggregatilineales bacterium]|nr:S8 family serine peptidase [Aggregatilineales bacterium]